MPKDIAQTKKVFSRRFPVSGREKVTISLRIRDSRAPRGGKREAAGLPQDPPPYDRRYPSLAGRHFRRQPYGARLCHFSLLPSFDSALRLVASATTLKV